MRTYLKSPITLAAFAAIGGFVLLALVEVRAEQAQQQEKAEPHEAESRVSHDAGGEVIVTLDPETKERIGMVAQPLSATTRRPQLVAYGGFQIDPSRTFTLRAPVAGILGRAPSREWPNVGQTIASRSVVAVIRPRLTPLERIDLKTRLAAAKGDLEETEASLLSARASYKSKKILHEQGRAVSDLTFEEAEAKLKGLEARRKAVAQTISIIEESLADNVGPDGSMPLTVERAGEVLEVPAQPGESIEAGQTILRLARFDRLIARVELPAGERIDDLLPTATIVPLGSERSLRGKRIGVAPTAGEQTQGQALLFEVATGASALRPGLSVTAFLELPGEPLKGVAVPRSAVVRFAGKAWVYVQQEREKFARREIRLEHPTPEGWFVTSGVASGDRLVVRGAQMLLSEELKTMTGEEEE